MTTQESLIKFLHHRVERLVEENRKLKERNKKLRADNNRLNKSNRLKSSL